MKLSLLILISGITLFSACNKNCDSDNVHCKDIPPTDEACQAYFETWFYDSSTKECQKRSYSGCSARGFETQQECEKCKCK